MHPLKIPGAPACMSIDLFVIGQHQNVVSILKKSVVNMLSYHHHWIPYVKTKALH